MQPSRNNHPRNPPPFQAILGLLPLVGRTEPMTVHSHAFRNILKYGRDKETGSKSSPFILVNSPDDTKLPATVEARGSWETDDRMEQRRGKVGGVAMLSNLPGLPASRICCILDINNGIILFEWMRHPD